MLCAFVVMKCEGFGYITDLVDYLENNRIIAYYCGFDITKKLPSYWTYDRNIAVPIKELPICTIAPAPINVSTRKVRPPVVPNM